MALNHVRVSINDGGSYTQEYYDARTAVSSSGFSFEPNAAYDAYKMMSSLNEDLIEITNSLLNSQELIVEINNNLELYFSSVRMLVEYADYITPFLTKFQDYISNISTIDPSFGAAFNLLVMSEGEIDLELIQNKSYKDLQQMNNDYSLICEWANKTGHEDAKKYYTLEELKKENEILYYRFMEYFNIQYWASTQGFEYGEFPCYSYSEFKRKGKIPLPKTEELRPLPLPKRSELVEYKPEDGGYLSYNTFSYEMPSLELFYFEKGIPHAKHELSELTEWEATEFLEWSYWRNEEISFKVKTLGVTINSSDDARKAITQLEQSVNTLWDKVFEYKVADVGTACLNFMEDGMYNYNHQYFDEDANDYVVGYIYINAAGRKDFVMSGESNIVAADSNVDKSTVQPVYLSNYAEHNFYQEFRKQFMSDSNFEDHWYNSELYLQAVDMKQIRETKLSGALETFNRENDTLTELKSLNSLVNDLALENVETVMITWKPDFPEFSKKIDISADVEIIKDRFIYNAGGEVNGILHLQTEEELADVLYAVISADGSFQVGGYGGDGLPWFYNSDGGVVNVFADSQMLSNYSYWCSVMSDVEKSAFYYKYQKEGKKSALNYLDEISQVLNDRWVANEKMKDAEYAKEHPWLATGLSVIVTPFEGLSAAAYSLSSLIRDEKIYSTRTYSSGDVLRQSVATNIAASDEIWGETLSFLYSTGMSMADSALLLATNALTGGSMTLLLSTGLMGSRAYVSTLNDALDRGLSDGQSVALAFSAAAAESICESISVGKLLDLDNTLNAVLGNKLAGINNKTMHSIVKVFGGAVIQGFSEGQEEVCTELLNFLTDSLISGDLSSFRLSVEEKIANGYSESDAIAEATIENFEQVMLSFLGGFISGGVNGGVFTTVGTIKTENDISKIASDIDSMYKNSTTNYDIKSLQLNLRHGNYAEAFSGLLGFNGVDITNKLLASKMLYESLCASGNLDYSQHLVINSAIDGGIQQFTGLNQNQQLEQFNKLDVDNQISLLNMLNSGGISVFKSLDTEIQKNLFNNDKLDLSVKLSILSSLDANGQNLVLPQETDVLTYIANNSSDIINAQVNSLDSSIASMVSDLKKLLFNNKVQLVNEINIKYFDSLLSKAMENPSEISSLITKYSASVDSSNMDTFNQLMYLLTVEVNNRYNLMNSSDIANSIVQKNSDLDYNTVLATLIIPSNMHNAFNLDSKILYNNDQVSSDTDTGQDKLGLNSDISNIQTQIDNLSYVKTTIPQYIKNYLLSNIRKYSYKDTSNFEGLNQQIMENGLYHFTTAADAILESGYIKASGVNASYGKPKSFFFNGVPAVGAFATNLDSIPLKTTAIKVNPTEDLVNSSKLKIRYIDDMAITYDGKFDLTGYDVEKCHFILVLENGNLVYKQVSQEVYDSYETTNMAKALSDYVSNKDNVTAIKADFLVDIANKNANNGQNAENLFDTKTYSVDPTYGFQLDNSSFGEFFKAKIESGFFTSEQVKLMLERVNSKGFISENSGKYYTQLFEEGEYDIYVKTVHSSDISSIMSEGIRCLGSSTSGYGGAPTSVSDINLGNTVTKVDGTYDLFSTLKSANGISQGMNPIDGTIVVKVPKGIDVNDIFYFNESTNTYNIKPEYVDSFSAVDSNGVVSDPLFNDMFTDILDVTSDLMDFSKINIEEAHEAIIQLSDKNGIASNVDKNWIIGFYDLLMKNNVSNTQINSVMSLLLSKENINNINKCMVQFGSTAPNIVDSSSYSYFYNYLNSIESKIDSNYLETGIKYIIENNNSNTNVIDQFIKYVVVTNFDDVRYVSNLSNIAVDAINDKITGVNSFNTGAKPISIKLGDFEIAYIDDITFTDNNEIMIDEVYTRKNLTGTKLGSLMFENLFGELNSLFPGRNVVVSRIMYNNFGAMKFYEMQGGKLFQFGLNGYEQISFSEYDVSKNIEQHNLIAVYDSEQFKELSIKPIEKPVITLSDGTIITTVSDKTINGEYIDYSENGIYRWNGYSFPSHFVVKSGVSIPTQVLYDVLNDKKNNRKVFEDSKDYNGYLNNDIKEAIVDLYKISKSQNMDLSILPLFEERILSYIDYINENANIDSTKKFSSATDIAIYFGDSNLYLQSLLVQKNVNKVISLSLSQMAQLKNQLYRGDVSTINYVKSLLTESELDVYNQILSNESNSLQSSWISKLSTEERNALRNYAEMFGSIDADTALEMYGYDSNGNSYVTLTELMRAGVADGIPSLDSAIEKFGVLPSEIVTYRGVGLEALTQQFGKIDLNNLSTLIGQVYTDKAYMSTSLLESKAYAAMDNAADVILKISVPTDANYGAYIESQSNLNYKQLEFLIKKNSTSVIQNAYVNENGKVVIEMKLVDNNSSIQNKLAEITDPAVIEAGIKNGTITKGQVQQLFNDFVGDNLASWVLNEDSSTSLYVNLLESAQNAGIELTEVKSCIGVLDSMSKYYEEARDGLKDKLETGKGFFNTYRTHGIVHAMDVLTQSINSYAAFNNVGVQNLSLKTIMLSAVMHDTGMSGGKEIYFIVNREGKLEPWIKDEANADGGIYRKSHSFNSGVDIILEFEALQKAGYSDLEIAEAAILTFAHSKSNSGLKSLSSNEAGWSFAIQALAAATKDSGFDILDVLKKNGVIKSDNIHLELFAVPNPSGQISEDQNVIDRVQDNANGKAVGKIEVYDFNLDWIQTAGYESLIVRIGDALTNNDNAGTNQYGKAITFKNTNYNNQLSFEQLMKDNGIDTSLPLDEQLAIMLERFGLPDGNEQRLSYLSLAEAEAKSVTYEIDGEETTKSPQFVLGENNQTYRIEAVSENDVEVVVSIKHSEAVPFCTIFAIDERAGELISKGDLLLNKAVDGKTIKIVIELDSTTSDTVKSLYQQYSEHAGIDVEIREVNKLAEITEPAVIEAGIKNGTITKGQVQQLFNDFVGDNLASWVLNEDSSTSLYVNLLESAQNAGIELTEVKSCIGVLDSMSKYYEEARDGLKDKLETGKGFFNTYRTHGIVHAMDVLTQSINSYAAFNNVGVQNLSLKTIMLSAVMHDTGMSGGKEIYFIVNREGKLEPWIKDEANADGGIYRKSHSFNSGVDIILEFEALQKAGYSDLEIAEAAILTFAHSKSNSGLKSLSSNEAGWSFAIQALAAATKDSGFDILDVLKKNGVIKSDNIHLELFAVPNPSGQISEDQNVIDRVQDNANGKAVGKIEVYDFNLDWIQTAGYESLIVRIGDALTNNDNAGTNQYGKAITFKNTNYNNQLSFEQLMKDNGIDTSLPLDEQLAIMLERFGLPDGNEQRLSYLSLAEAEAKSVTYEIDGEETTKSPQFVLGENNQTYRIEAVSENDVEVVVSIKHSEAVPFCTIFAIDERAGELISKGDLLLNKAVDGKTIKIVIELDSTTSDTVKSLYQQYSEHAGIDVEIREVNKLAEITEPAVIEAGIKNGTITKGQVQQLFNDFVGDNLDSN